MRPVPLAVDLELSRAADVDWPDCSGVREGPQAYDCLFTLNWALTHAVGVGGWRFEWAPGCLGVGRVPAVLESVTAARYPRPGSPARVVVTASGVVRTVVVPSEGASGDLGELVTRRLGGVVWRYPGGEASVRVAAVRVVDPLRDPLEMWRSTVEACRSRS